MRFESLPVFPSMKSRSQSRCLRDGARKRAAPVRDMTAFLHERFDDPAQRQQTLVDVARLGRPLADRPRPSHTLRPGQIDQVEPSCAEDLGPGRVDAPAVVDPNREYRMRPSARKKQERLSAHPATSAKQSQDKKRTHDDWAFINVCATCLRAVPSTSNLSPSCNVDTPTSSSPRTQAPFV